MSIPDIRIHFMTEAYVDIFEGVKTKKLEKEFS
jgi:hypothetical protein